MSVQLKPLYDKDQTCLFCEKIYQTKRLRSKFVRVKQVHSDFYTEYKDPDLNPLFYEVSVCPHCGFASSDTFSSNFPSGTTNVIAEQFKDWKMQDFGNERKVEDAIRALKLGILSAMLKREKHVVIGGLCLRLAWLFRLISSEEQEIRFLKKAQEHYAKSYEEVDYKDTQMTDMRLLYLIGELHRRIGNQSEAIQFFSRVIQHKHKATEPKIVEMAREQWYLIREKNDEEATI
ncbi:DUF2225 domain-containing protein [Halalkalibacter urbisdiaboli]|uniref:DUF2225 domain-containing protein n=1 Tax=Halalkalibacter urbisdiaboli TaxID=1960589 RepID=UPI000B43F032|nr:DUF2225 domain-containing protein [Halalkalibacter urbisdiaboli]